MLSKVVKIPSPQNQKKKNMKLNEIIKASGNINGHITVMGRNKGGEWFTILEKKNALTSNAVTIISKALGGDTGWNINAIRAYKTSGILATASVTATYPATNKVQLQAIFSEASFNDTLDEVRLLSLTGGDFSIVTGLSINKPNTLELSIQWLLTIL